jgi:hypothetical protein
MANSDIPGDEVYCVALDQTGGLWVGTSAGGAARLDYTTAIDHLAGADDVRVFPSPCTDVLNWNAGQDLGQAEYRLTDAFGRQVGAGRLAGKAGILDVNALAAGSYLLTISGNRLGISRTVRFLKA